MHEMSLAESILQIVEETARSSAADQVRAVRLEIGTLSHVERDALRFCFDAVTRGTLADGARLEIDSAFNEGTAVALIFPRDRVVVRSEPSSAAPVSD